MTTCEVCGNEYDKAFTVTLAGQAHTFDSFECAIHARAPACAHCRCKVIGHGVEQDGTIYCCVHCAARCGATGRQDRAAAERRRLPVPPRQPGHDLPGHFRWPTTTRPVTPFSLWSPTGQ